MSKEFPYIEKSTGVPVREELREEELKEAREELSFIYDTSKQLLDYHAVVYHRDDSTRAARIRNKILGYEVLESRTFESKDVPVVGSILRAYARAPMHLSIKDIRTKSDPQVGDFSLRFYFPKEKDWMMDSEWLEISFDPSDYSDPYHTLVAAPPIDGWSQMVIPYAHLRQTKFINCFSKIVSPVLSDSAAYLQKRR